MDPWLNQNSSIFAAGQIDFLFFTGKDVLAMFPTSVLRQGLKRSSWSSTPKLPFACILQGRAYAAEVTKVGDPGEGPSASDCVSHTVLRENPLYGCRSKAPKAFFACLGACISLAWSALQVQRVYDELHKFTIPRWLHKPHLRVMIPVSTLTLHRTWSSSVGAQEGMWQLSKPGRWDWMWLVLKAEVPWVAPA